MTESSFISPLGLLAESTRTATAFLLPAGDQLTIVTDGVIEARNGRGEPFGFEQAQMVSKRTTGEIAEAAKLFGQDDDITVLTIVRTAQPAWRRVFRPGNRSGVICPLMRRGGSQAKEVLSKGWLRH